MKALQYLLVLAFIWITVVIGIQRFKCVKLTETEMFLQIPKNFILEFKTCN